MKNAIELFSTLGEQLRKFGKDADSQAILAAACRRNDWFTPQEVMRAIDAIRSEMLQRDKLERWLSAYPAATQHPRSVLVVMAGNIPAVGFFDLLCVVAAGHRCQVKPSGKDAVLIGYLIDLLHTIDPDVPVSIYDGRSPIEAVIATGSDNANRYFRTAYAGIPALLRGNRHSVAILTGTESEAQLRGLCNDIWTYSGLGCRNVSLIFLPTGCKLQIKSPQMSDKYRNNYLQTRALHVMQQIPFVDLGTAIAVEQRAFPLALSQIAYTYYTSREEVEAWLNSHDDELQCVVSESIPHSRQVRFGAAQSPSLTDYPDARDVINWLARL